MLPNTPAMFDILKLILVIITLDVNKQPISPVHTNEGITPTKIRDTQNNPPPTSCLD
jgi:hypothetical protein